MRRLRNQVSLFPIIVIRCPTSHRTPGAEMYSVKSELIGYSVSPYPQGSETPLSSMIIHYDTLRGHG